jgi:ABC-type Fe3+/spermidine/putrescine transport system ATPase subunit
MKPSTALELDAVVRDYGRGAVVGPISCTIERGEFVSLLGPSGCGKTTMLRCIAGFEQVSHGVIRVDGQDVTRLPAYKRGIGLVFQSYALFPHLTVRQNVAFGLKLLKIEEKETTARLLDVLAKVGLSNLADRYPPQLSGGQQQRVAIARSVVLNPPLLLLDEPLSNLDFKLRIQMRAELRKLQRELGTTFVYVTHDQTEALAMSDRIIVLSNGHVEQIGSPSEIYRAPATRFVADFIGASNLLKARQIVDVGGHPTALLDGGLSIRCAIGHGADAQARWVSVRPESIEPQLGGHDSDMENLFRAKVLTMTFCGDKYEASVVLSSLDGSSMHDGTLSMHLKPDFVDTGSLIVRIDPSNAVLVGEAA